MSDREIEDNDSTAGLEDDDEAAGVGIIKTTVLTLRPHPNRQTREARRETVRTRSASVAPADCAISPVEGRAAASSMAKRLMVPPCLQDLAVDQKKTVEMNDIELASYHQQLEDTGRSLENKLVLKRPQ